MREPLIGLVPLGLTFTSFFSNKGKGLYMRGLPMSLVIMLIGTTLWWCGLARWDTGQHMTDPIWMKATVVLTFCSV